MSRGKVYLEKENFEEAIADFSLAIKYNARLGEAYFYRGACKDAIKDVEGACADLKKAASLNHQEAERRLKNYCK
jgi:tetratricopeptide (TPR) repeat protein